jgi:hypothetical protein
MKRNDGKGKRVRIGDVFEFTCEGYFFYVQYTHDDPLYGELLQMPIARFKTRLQTWPPGVTEVTAFCTAIGSMVRAGYCTAVGNFPIPEELTKHPLMVTGSPEEGAHQWLWDGERRIEPNARDVLKGLPRRSAIGYPVLLERASTFPIVASE